MIALKLPTGKTESEALAIASKWRHFIWNDLDGYESEDEKLDALKTICVGLCEGDSDSGNELAKRAIWGG